MNDLSGLSAAIRREAAGLPVIPRIMEVCGTHTVAIAQNGLREMLAGAVDLVSGPGCPVCVTPAWIIDAAASIAARGAVVATFGDMMRVPGNRTSLAVLRALGADIRTVCSPLDLPRLAASEAGRDVVFIAVGFETTAPGTALLLRKAAALDLRNLFLLTSHRLIPPAMRALLASGVGGISGFICPGHVAAIIGSAPFRQIAVDHGIPCVVSGFEPADILQSVLLILQQLRTHQTIAFNQYGRAVRLEGNKKALAALAEVFMVENAYWRGLGKISDSGLSLRLEWERFDAFRRYDLEQSPGVFESECCCDRVMRGEISPEGCRFFAESCTPEDPRGPCMVSSEGPCRARYLYGGTHHA